MQLLGLLVGNSMHMLSNDFVLYGLLTSFPLENISQSDGARIAECIHD